MASFQADQRLQGTKVMKAKAHVDAEKVENELDDLMGDGVAQRQRSRFSTNSPGFDFLISGQHRPQKTSDELVD